MTQSFALDRRRGTMSLAAVFAVAAIAAGTLLPGCSDDGSSADEVEVLSDDKPDEKPDTDTGDATDTASEKPSTEYKAARFTKLLIGSWTREAYGTRTLTINEDATAKFVIKPSSFYAFVFGPEIIAEIEWELQGEYLDYGITGGTPADKLQLAKDSWGDHWHEKITRLDGENLILLGEDGQKYHWTRVKTPASDEGD